MSSLIRCDGLYVGEASDGYRSYLRFFPSGYVVSASVTEPATPEQVGKWLGMPGRNEPKGNFRMQDGTVSFETVIPGSVDYRDGTEYDEIRVEYEGPVLEDGSLLLKSHSFATNHRCETMYRFAPKA